MHISEAVKIARELADNNLVNENKNKMPYYCPSKSGRFWFSGKNVSVEQIEALLGYALLVSQQPIVFSEKIEITVDETSKIDTYEYIGRIELDIDGAVNIPMMFRAMADYTYANRSNGYCSFNTFLNDGFLEIGGELCVDELWAIHSICKDIK